MYDKTKVEKVEEEKTKEWPGIMLMKLNEGDPKTWEELAECCGPIRPCLGLFSDL